MSDDQNSDRIKVDIIIPAFNEEKSITKVIEGLSHPLLRHIIVCDNNSTDNTNLVAETAGAIVLNEQKKGYGSACLKGLEFIKATTERPEIVAFIDGDYSDYPEQLDRILSPITESDYDMVIGSRNLGKRAAGSMTIPQIFGNWLATTLIRLIYGYKFTDLGPFRAIKYEQLVVLNMVDRDFGWTVEMQIKAAKHGLKCKEVPVDYRRRIGKSKVSGTINGTLRAGHKILWTIFKLR